MTSFLEIQRCPERKQKRKHLRGTEKQKWKRKTKRKWKANEEIGSSLRELKTRRLVLTD